MGNCIAKTGGKKKFNPKLGRSLEFGKEVSGLIKHSSKC